MIHDHRPLRPSELADDGAGLDGEVGSAWAVARSLERALDATADSRPGDGFVDRVMAALENEPAPARAAFVAPLQAGPSLASLVASLRAAWHAATQPGLRLRPRATALAYVLAVLLVGGSAVGAAGYGLAGALGWLGPASSPSPSLPVLPGPTSVPPPSRTETLEPGETVGPGETGQPGGGLEPTGRPGATDDHGGGAPGASDDHGGANLTASPTPSPSRTDGHGGGPTPSSGETQTPKPSQTPEATQTAKPSETPKPTSTSGSGSGSGSDG